MEEQTATGPNTSTTATSSVAAAPAATQALMLGNHTHVMDGELMPWLLYDLTGAKAPDTLDTMKDHFRRFRGLRKKLITGVDYESLQRSWCVFIRRWNRMYLDGRNFVGRLSDREEVAAEHSLSDLRERVCDNAWTADRLCFVHVKEGCSSCSTGRRPTEGKWLRHIAERPLSEWERPWVARYQRTRAETAPSRVRLRCRRRA